MARLTVGWPVIGSRTADGSDAIQSVDPTVFASSISLGNMSYQNNNAVNVLGGNLSGVAITASSLDVSNINATIGSTTRHPGAFSTILAEGASPFVEIYNTGATRSWELNETISGNLVFTTYPITGGHSDAAWFLPNGILHLTNGLECAGSMTVPGTLSATGDISTSSTMHASILYAGNSALTTANSVGASATISSVHHWNYSSVSATEAWIGIKEGDSFGIVEETIQGAKNGVWILRYDEPTETVHFNVSTQFSGTKIGFYGTTPVVKVTISYPSSIITTETANLTYSSNEQLMLDHLKADVTNLRTRLNECIVAMKGYGLIG
jgi:hypothetical protein